MKSIQILNRLTKNREDLEIIRANPTDLPKALLDSIIKRVEERSPYKACELFKLFNALHQYSDFPEDNVYLDDVIRIFQERGKEIDIIIETAKSDESLIFIPYPNLNAKKVVSILLSQMLSNAEEATFELQIHELIKNKFG